MINSLKSIGILITSDLARGNGLGVSAIAAPQTIIVFAGNVCIDELQASRFGLQVVLHADPWTSPAKLCDSLTAKKRLCSFISTIEEAAF